MAGSYLKRRGQTWYVQLAVPASRQKALGCKVLVKSLRTHDHDEANRLKHAVLAELQQLITGESPSRPPKARPQRTAEDILRMAVEERRHIEDGGDSEGSETGFDAMVDDFLDERAKAVGRDRDGNPLLPAEEHALVRRAYKALSGRLELTLGNRIEAYLSEQTPRLTAQTVADKRRRLEEFGAWFGVDREVTEATRADAGRYVAEVIQKRTIKTASEKETPLSPTTKKKEVSDLRSFFDWLITRGYVEANPFDRMSSTVRGSTRGKASARRPWTHEELSTALHAFDVNDALWSFTVIGMFTGMRREEIAELRVNDLDGAVLKVQQGKTAAAVRRVPVHPALAPLVSRLAATSPDGYLIPGLLPGGPDKKRAWYVGKRFGYAIRKLGLADEAIDFHALRGTFITKLEEAGTPEPTIQLIVGHRRQGVTLGTYSGGRSDEAKAREIEKVSYGAELDSYVVEAGARVAISTAAKPRKRD